MEEVYQHNGILQAIIKLDSFASICELDAYQLNHNFGDTLRCQVEHYYQKMQLGAHSPPSHETTGIASAHDRISYKHQIAAEDTEADDHPRSLFVDRLDGEFIVYQHESPTVENNSFRSDHTLFPIRKNISLEQNRLHVDYHFSDQMKQIFTTEINLAMPSCDGMGGRYVYQGKIPGGFGQLLELNHLTEIILDDDTLGGSVVLRTSSPVTLRAYPHYSVSQSESGFEKIMQAVTLQVECPTPAQGLNITLEINAR